MNSVVYIRVSTESQQTEGTSLQTQKEECIRFARSSGWSVTDVYQDSSSGYDLDRPGLNRLRKLVRTGHVDIVLCYALDRLSRNQNQIGLLFSEMKDRNIRLEFVSEKFEDNPIGRFILSAKAFVAEIEREKIA